MPKGYWIARVDVSDEKGYEPYRAANPAIFRKFGGRFIVRGGPFECPEGASRSRNVVIEFPSYEQALACYRSPEYQNNIRCGNRTRPPTSSSSRATRARSRRTESTDPGRSPWPTCG